MTLVTIGGHTFDADALPGVPLDDAVRLEPNSDVPLVDEVQST